MSFSRKIILGSRGSDLALWQARHVQQQLLEIGVTSDIKIIKTSGDQIQNIGFDKMEGKGFFTKEIEEALLRSEIDIAVHSHKDLETTNPEGLIIAAVSQRADARDLLIMRKDRFTSSELKSGPENPNLGTSSARRKALIQHHFPNAKLSDLRGNVPTRVQKLRDGLYDAILLAKAGIDRLEIDLSEFHLQALDPSQFVPAPAQGVLGIQARANDLTVLEILQKLNHQETQLIINAERSVLKQIGGGCQVPLGAYCSHTNGLYTLHVAYAKKWREPMVFFRESGDNPAILAQKITDQIIKHKL